MMPRRPMPDDAESHSAPGAGQTWLVTFVGTGGPSNPSRRPPCVHLTLPERRYLIDAGDGLCHGMAACHVLGVPDAVMLTSLDTHRIAGLLALADFAARLPNAKPLRVIGMQGAQDAVDLLLRVAGDTVPRPRVTEVGPGAAFWEGGIRVRVAICEARQGQAAVYSFEEPALPGHIDVERAREHGIQGAEFGRLQRGETIRGITLEDVSWKRRQGRKLVVAGGGRPVKDAEGMICGADVAVFCAPHMDEMLHVAQHQSMLTGWQAAALAARCGVGMVCLTQVAPSGGYMAYRLEAAQFHDNVMIPADGDVIEVPLLEKGRPVLMTRQRAE